MVISDCTVTLVCYQPQKNEMDQFWSLSRQNEVVEYLRIFIDIIKLWCYYDVTNTWGTVTCYGSRNSNIFTTVMMRPQFSRRKKVLFHFLTEATGTPYDILLMKILCCQFTACSLQTTLSIF